jgi:GNAT superfamily N-acetyltransferase
MRAREFITEISRDRLERYLGQANRQIDSRQTRMAQARERLNRSYEIYHADRPAGGTQIVDRFEANTPQEAQRYYEKFITRYESDRDFDLQLRRSTGIMEDAFRGIDISMEKEDDEIMVRASSGGKQLGSVLFVEYDGVLTPQDLEVDERFRGQGIARTMYDYVKRQGYRIRRSGQQTDAGQGFWAKHRPEQNVWEHIAEQSYVTRIDSRPIADFSQGMQTYYHTADFSRSGQFDKDTPVPKEYTGKMTGVYAGDPTFTALYATGNANQTRYVAKYGPGQPIVYFDRKDVPAMRARRTYLTVFDGSRFKRLPTGEYFSDNPGQPIKQQEIKDPFQYIKDRGWEFRIVDDLPAVLKQLQQQNKKDPSVRFGAEGMGLEENFADGRVKGKSRPGRVKRAGASCAGSVTDLRKRAKAASGEKAKMYHWCANMKSGKRRK